MSSLRFTGFMYVVLLFCLLDVSCHIAQSVLAMEENPQFIKNSVLKVSSRTSSRVINKGLLPKYEVAGNFSENDSEEGGAISRKMRKLLKDNSELNSRETAEEGVGSSHEKQSSISEGEDEKYHGFTGNAMKVGLDVRNRLRLRSKKGKGHGNGGDAGGFVAFNADYHFPRQHPPRNN